MLLLTPTLVKFTEMWVMIRAYALGFMLPPLPGLKTIGVQP